MKIFENFSLKNYNTFKLDVTTRFFVKLSSDKDLPNLAKSGHLKTGSFLTVGEGSNLLFRDNYKGTVIHPDFKGIQVIEETENSILLRLGPGKTGTIL
jgi:UDP-N-acetylmuramate dehydrogenase